MVYKVYMEFGIYGSHCAARMSWLVNSLLCFLRLFGKGLQFCNRQARERSWEKSFTEKVFFHFWRVAVWWFLYWQGVSISMVFIGCPKKNKMVENRSGSLPEVLDVTALRELVTGNLEKLDRNSGRGKSMYHIFHLLMESHFLASKKIEAHLLTTFPFVQPSQGLVWKLSIFHSEYSNPAKKTLSCKLLGRQ